MGQKRILITNDDGIQAQGLKAAEASLAAVGEVLVVAPEREMSATSQAISIHFPLRVRVLDERHYAVSVRLADAQRTIANLRSITVSTAGGAYVPISQVAEFSTIGGAMNIARENGARVHSIGIFIAERDMGSVVSDMKDRVTARVKLPPGYSITWSGEFENQERAMARLSIIVPVSVLLIFILLFDAFGAFRSALLILLNIPFALIGGIFALLITGIPLSVSAAASGYAGAYSGA